jgi:hypothetical protein
VVNLLRQEAGAARLLLNVGIGDNLVPFPVHECRVGWVRR